jgi:anaerobic selenocysteine-containing dehydrogenase
VATRDRIAEPWGARTPYERGQCWPDRVDMYLADGVVADSVDRWVRTASVLHSNGDGLDIAVKDERMVGVRGRANDRINHGRVDPKDLFAWQANGSADRLSTPLIRERGALVPTDWDTAMDRIVLRTKTLLDEHGPGSIGFYTFNVSRGSCCPSSLNSSMASRLAFRRSRACGRCSTTT